MKIVYDKLWSQNGVENLVIHFILDKKNATTFLVINPIENFHTFECQWYFVILLAFISEK